MRIFFIFKSVWCLIALCLGMTTSVFAMTGGSGLVRLHDGEGGATYDYFDSASKLLWERRGGDWIDALGRPFGSKPFVTVRVAAVHRPAPVIFDVTSLMHFASKLGHLPGVLISGLGGGEAVIAARENSDPSMRPMLTLVTDDGSKVHLNARADTYTNSTTNRSLGTKGDLRAGANQSILIDFDIDPSVLGHVRKAELHLSPVNLYGKDALLSAFLLGGAAMEERGPVQHGIAAAVGEVNLAEHGAVLFTERFDSDDWISRWSVFGSRSDAHRAAQDSSSRLPGGHMLTVTIRANTNLGLDLRYLFKEKNGVEPEAVYLRYYVRFPSRWNTPVDGGKLPGLAGTYGRAGWGGRTPDGYNGWNMRSLFFRQAPENHPLRDKVIIGTEASIPEVVGLQEERHFAWDKGFGGILEKGRWYCIEQYVKLNQPERADGIFRSWVDGRLAFERTGMVYRLTDTLKIEAIWMNVYHGGQSPSPTDIPTNIANIVAATEYIGPGSEQ